MLDRLTFTRFSPHILMIIVCTMVAGISLSFSTPILSTCPEPERLTPEIEWLTFQEAIKRSKIEPRKILVNVSTQWCPACRKMDESTFKNKNIVEYVSKRFYAVKFDAGSSEEIALNGELYKKEGRVHHLAMYLSRRGDVVFPTYSIMDEEFRNPQAIYGYQDASGFDKFLTYFGENHHERTEWEIFEEAYVYEKK